MPGRQPKVISPRATHGDADVTREFQRMVAELAEGGENELIVDLASVRVVESIFLGALVATAHMLRASGGDLRLCNVGRDVRTIMQLSGIDKVIEVSESVADAMRRFAEDQSPE